EGEGANPYFAMLGSADHIFVTSDSVNMAMEAAATGKPVHVLAVEGAGGKLDRFHESLVRRGCARPFNGRLETWNYPPLLETDRVAAGAKRHRYAHRRELCAERHAGNAGEIGVKQGGVGPLRRDHFLRRLDRARRFERVIAELNQALRHLHGDQRIVLDHKNLGAAHPNPTNLVG